MSDKSCDSGKTYDEPKDSWMDWCRLCAKENNKFKGFKIFKKSEQNVFDSSLATAIGKYFWVNIKIEDEIPTQICEECHILIGELIEFTERVNKVQTMYCLLSNLKPSSLAQANTVREQCGLSDDKWRHIIHIDSSNFNNSSKYNNCKEYATEELLVIDNVNAVNESEQEPAYIFVTKGDDVYNEIDLNDVQDIKQSVHIITGSTNDSIGAEEEEQTFVFELNQQNFHQSNSKRAIQSSESKQTEIVRSKRKITSQTPEKMNSMDDDNSLNEMKYKVEEDDEDSRNLPQEKCRKLLSSQESAEDDSKIDNFNSNSNSNSNSNKESYDNEEDEDDDEEDDDDDDYVIIEESGTQSSTDVTSSTNVLDLLRKRPRGRPSNSSRGYESKYRYECKTCKRKYKNPNVYRKHMENVHKIIIDELPDFVCTICNKNCQTESRLKNHVRMHMPTEEKLNVPCPYCGRKFSQVGAMRQHVNGIHHQMKPYICDQCGRACKTLAALNEHQLVHTNECPFECEVCKRKFKNKARLKCHMDTHAGSTHICSDCGLQLNTRRTLLAHRLVHTDEKRYKCEFCDAAFKRSKAFKNHLILHTGLRPYKCNFCGKTFSNGSNCRSHKKKAHPKELADEEARGFKSIPVPVPKLEDLKSVRNVLVQPRKVRRGVLTDRLCTLLKSADKVNTKNETNENLNTDTEITSPSFEDSKMQEYEIESVFPDDGEEETVIYEIIDEI